MGEQRYRQCALQEEVDGTGQGPLEPGWQEEDSTSQPCSKIRCHCTSANWRSTPTCRPMRHLQAVQGYCHASGAGSIQGTVACHHGRGEVGQRFPRYANRTSRRTNDRYSTEEEGRGCHQGCPQEEVNVCIHHLPFLSIAYISFSFRSS